MKKTYVVMAMFFLIILNTQSADAMEPVMITISDTMNQVIFDGKWSFTTEWKSSSLNELSYNDETIELRTAHQGNFIYILVDVLYFGTNSRGNTAIVCFDTKNDKSQTPDNDDYCFGVPFEGKNGFVLKGGSPLAQTSYFAKIPNPEGFIGISSISDDNDRYTTSPHPSYEFRIPTDLIGRSDVYGFYLGYYKANSNTVDTWPQGITINSPYQIPSPSTWGEMVSPDHTLPEFPWPILTLVFVMFIVIYLTKTKSLLGIRKIP